MKSPLKFWSWEARVCLVFQLAFAAVMIWLALRTGNR